MSFEMDPNFFQSIPWKKFEDDRDPDLNYFNEINIPSNEMTYINETDKKNFLHETQRFANIFVLHVDIRELKSNFENLRNNTENLRNFENLRNLLNNTVFSFDIICFTETWCSSSKTSNSFCFVVVIARCRVQQGKYFPSFLYFVTYFASP